MAGKFFLYILVAVITIYAMDSLNINGIFKKNRVIQARILYFMIFLSLTYLTTNCIYDLFITLTNR
jgi:uncharacterized membrane protein YwzB